MVRRRCRRIVVLDSAAATPTSPTTTSGTPSGRSGSTSASPSTFDDAAHPSAPRAPAPLRGGDHRVLRGGRPAARTGSLIYVKPMLLGNEPPGRGELRRRPPGLPPPGDRATSGSTSPRPRATGRSACSPSTRCAGGGRAGPWPTSASTSRRRTSAQTPTREVDRPRPSPPRSHRTPR